MNTIRTMTTIHAFSAVYVGLLLLLLRRVRQERTRVLALLAPVLAGLAEARAAAAGSIA